MDSRLTQDSLIDDALSTQPLAEMPCSITADVMAAIHAADARPAALLTWTDFVLSAVSASCIAAVWFAVQNLPPIFINKIRMQSILLYQDFLVNARWLVPSLFFGTAALLAFMTIPALIKMTVHTPSRS